LPDNNKGAVCLYVASRGHSGSTILEVLLGRHREIAAGGEVANFALQCYRDGDTSWRGECSCGARPFDCPVWGQVIAAVEAEYHVNMRQNPFAFRLSDVGLEEEFRGRRAPFRVPFSFSRRVFWRYLRYQQYTSNHALATLLRGYRPQAEWAMRRGFVLSKLAEIQGRNAIIDSSKDPLDMRDLYEHSSMPVKILFLTRDCRGNVFSFIKRHGLKYGREGTIKRAARDWVAVNSRISQLLEGIGRSDWMHLRYEDLCRNPAKVLASVFDFMNLPDDPSILDDREHLEHSIAGNKIRFSNKQALIKEDTAWQEHFEKSDLELIARISSPLAQRLGYDV
jgi:hypothetical protein